MPGRSPLVVFDLDGTLIDTGPDLLASLNHVIAGEGLAPLELADLDHLVGQGARAMIGRAFALNDVALSAENGDRLFAAFIDHYGAGMPGRSEPYPGLVETLDALEAAGCRFAVCTNKSETMALRLLEALGLAERFDAIAGGDSFPFRKPDGRHILMTIERAGGYADASIMIGDSINDIAAAREAGVPVIGVTFGYSDTPVADLNPDRVIGHFSNLTPALVGALLSERAA